MRAAVFHGRCDLRVQDVPEPEPGPGDVKLRVHYNGICGSDLHEYYAGPMTTRTEPHPLTGVKNPVIFGHELCGSVVALGEGVDDLAIGDKVAVEPVETCGRCLDCRSGHYNHCPLLAFHGYNRSGGGLADYTVVRRKMAHRLRADLTPAQGALIEPMAIAWATVRRCRVEAGQTVALHGAGPIGIGVLLVLRARGVRVIVSDPSPLRRQVMRSLGAATVLDPTEVDVVTAIRDLTGGRGAAASVDAAGVPAVIRVGMRSTAIDGNFVVVAIHEKPIVIPPFDLLMPEVRLTGVALSCNDFPAVIDAMAAGTFPTDGWVSTIPLEGIVENGFERLQRQEALKLLVDLGSVAPGAL